MNQPTSPTNHHHGFTLIELAVVLFIIGIILAAVMKGQNIVKTAQAHKAQQQYFLAWLDVVNGYHEITGSILGDGEANGGRLPASDGFMDGFSYGNSITDSPRNQPYPNNTVHGTELLTRLQQSGLTPCTTITTNLFNRANDCPDDMNPYVYVIDSAFGKTRVTLGLTNLHCTIGSTTQHRNVLVFLNVPLDTAMSLDTTIDGNADGQSGKCINFSNGGHDIFHFVGANYVLQDLNDANLTPANNPRASYPWPGPSTETTSSNCLFNIGIILDS